MTREEMMDKIINKYGLEAEETIWFCRLAEDESISLEALSCAMVCLEHCSFQAPQGRLRQFRKRFSLYHMFQLFVKRKVAQKNKKLLSRNCAM